MHELAGGHIPNLQLAVVRPSGQHPAVTAESKPTDISAFAIVRRGIDSPSRAHQQGQSCSRSHFPDSHVVPVSRSQYLIIGVEGHGLRMSRSKTRREGSV